MLFSWVNADYIDDGKSTMTLMSLLRFDSADLEANQRGRLSPRQCQMFPSLSALAQHVERITGLVALSSAQTKGGGQVQITVGGKDVILWGCDDLISNSSNIFDPSRLYTAYCVEVGQHKLLISVEEGPDWAGSQDG